MEATAQITVTPSSVPVGTSLTIKGTGYDPYDSAIVNFYKQDAFGRYSLLWNGATIPGPLPVQFDCDYLGNFTSSPIIIVSNDLGCTTGICTVKVDVAGQSKDAYVVVTIGGSSPPPPLSPTIGMNKSSLVPPDNITITGSSFSPNTIATIFIGQGVIQQIVSVDGAGAFTKTISIGTGVLFAGPQPVIAQDSSGKTSNQLILNIGGGCVPVQCQPGYHWDQGQCKCVQDAVPSHTVYIYVDETNPPDQVIPNATVTLGNQTKQTDNDGIATFPGTPDGSYALTVQKTGYQTLSTSISFSGDDATFRVHLVQQAPPPTSHRVDIYVNETATPDQPILGATVMLGTQTKQTDNSGTASFPNTPDGSYTLVVQKSGYQTLSTTISFYGDDAAFRVHLQQIAAGCTQDSQCPSGQHCVNGQCVPISTGCAGGCPTGFACINNSCVPVYYVAGLVLVAGVIAALASHEKGKKKEKS